MEFRHQIVYHKCLVGLIHIADLLALAMPFTLGYNPAANLLCYYNEE